MKMLSALFKTALLSLVTMTSLKSFASPISDFIQNFERQSELERAISSQEVCETLFKQWPQSTYVAWLQEAGSLYIQHPQATQYLLSLCNSIWTQTILGPQRAAETQKQLKQNPASMALNLLSSGILEGEQYLPEQIRLFSSVLPTTHTNQIPPAPFEVLSGLASSARQLDASVQAETRRKASQLAAMGVTAGVVIQDLRMAKAAAQTVTLSSSTAGRLLKAALLIAMASTLAEKAIDYKIERAQIDNAIALVDESVAKLESTGAQPPLLHEFSLRVDNLAYLYALPLKTKDGRKSLCGQELKRAADQNFDTPHVATFASSTCQDPALVWAAAASYLRARFPNIALTEPMASKFTERAIYSYMSYESEREADARRPVCRPPSTGNPFAIERWECVDPKTGAQVL